ncbi:MAG TPA: hypothetical protein VFV03_02815, partial [Solirubrobacteraceae bacterium]|nr:hypothetical protein [Solirubrobacteraceae bacterium]
MKLHAEFDCRMVKLSGGVECVGARAPRRRAVFATALAATLLLPTLGASPSTAAQARKPAQAWVLHADLLAQTAPTFSLAPAPRDLPLRVRDPRAYAAGKAAARRSYLARARRHASTRPRMAPQADAPRHSATAPSAALFEALNSPGMAAGGSFTEGTPPDTTGAIGPSDYFEMVNSQITVYSRALGLQATESEDEFTGG